MKLRLTVPALLLASFLAACSGSRCPEGTFRSGPNCVPLRTDGGRPPDMDAGTRDGGTVDASTSTDGAMDASSEDADSALGDADTPMDDGGEAGMADAGPCGPCPAARPICDEAAMRCVQCTAADVSACGAEPCDVAAGVCRVQLCEPCTSDAQCGDGRVCVMEPDGDSPRCVWREDATATGAPMGSCLEHGRPFVEPRDAITADGASVRVCLLGPSTCAAWLVFRSPVACATDADCGLDVGDGSCVDADPGAATVMRCTMTCVTDVDCPTGTTCDRGAARCRL